jgi:hypothetical protein
LDTLNQLFNDRPETQSIERLEGSLIQIAEQMDVLVLRLDHLPTSPEVDLGGINEAIADLKAQLDTLNQLFNDRPETQSIERLEGSLIQIAEQMDVLVLRLEHLPDFV